jgi:hypothetical protein
MAAGHFNDMALVEKISKPSCWDRFGHRYNSQSISSGWCHAENSYSCAAVKMK